MAELGFSLMTIKHYASMVGKKPRTIRAWIANGKIKARKDRGGRDWLVIVKDLNTFCKKEKSIP